MSYDENRISDQIDSGIREQQIRQAKIDKQLAIINICYNTLLAITKSAKRLPKKKPFGTKGRTPLRRIKRKLPLLEIMTQAYASAAQIAMIQIQPIPNYPVGEFRSGGIVYDNEAEYALTPQERFYFPPKLTPNNET